ncbi:hypothetical protein ACLKA7_011560 [Drosophila subpalustris]
MQQQRSLDKEQQQRVATTSSNDGINVAKTTSNKDAKTRTANKKRTIEKEGNMLHGGGNEKRVDYESSTGKQLEVRPSVVKLSQELKATNLLDSICNVYQPEELRQLAAILLRRLFKSEFVEFFKKQSTRCEGTNWKPQHLLNIIQQIDSNPEVCPHFEPQTENFPLRRQLVAKYRSRNS